MQQISDHIRQRFFNNISYNNCWIWKGTFDKVGLPNLKTTKKEYSARRLSLIFAGKELPANKLHIIGKCDNRSCVNPEHLLIGDEARFWSYVNKTDGCWFWTGAKDKQGYGKFLIKRGDLKKDVRAHRFSYELMHGPIDDPQILVCHVCDNPSCVRQDHLFAGSAKINNDDKINKGRAWIPIGEKNCFAKLDDISVQQILDLAATKKYSNGRIAKLFNVSRSNIGHILKGTTWKHIERK